MKMKLYPAVLAICLLAGPVLAQGDAAELETRLATATDDERLRLLVDLAELHRKTDPERTVELGTEALGLFETSTDRPLELRIASSLAHALGSLSQYREALENAERAEELARAIDDPWALAFAMSRGAYAHRKLGDNTVALAQYEEALLTFEQLDDRVNVAFCLTGRCRIRWRAGRFESALSDCLEAFAIFEQLGDRDEQTQALNYVGLTYSELGRSEEALDYLERALALQRENGKKGLTSRILNNIGVIYHEEGDYPKALEFYSESLELKSEIGDKVGVSRRLVNIGNVLKTLGHFDQAREKYQSALATAREAGFKAGVILATEGLAIVHAKQGNPEYAIALLEEALSIAAEIDEPQHYIYSEMSTIYEESGDFQKALTAHQEFERLKSKMLEEERNSNISEMLVRFDAEQKKKEIELLEHQQVVSALELERQRYSRLALVVGFGLTLIILLISFNRYRLKARAVAMKQAIDRERTVNARLREVDRLKDEFLANTSHELRTPLYGISGLAESLISGTTGELPMATKAHLSMIVASGRRLTTLVNDILDFSKLKHHGLELELKPVDLHAAVDVVLTLSRPLVGSKELLLANAIATDLPPALADENRLQQILHNLIGNAVKFTEAGKVEVSAAMDAGPPPRLVVSVRDTGIGIAKEQQATIFEAFTQADGTTEREFGGTGLGLTVARQLIELHGGRISVESTVGEGTGFSFTLPVSDQEAVAAAPAERPIFRRTEAEPSATGTQPNEEESPVSSARSRLPDGLRVTRLLVVDDEPVNLQVLSDQLSSEGYDVETAASGPEALRSMEEQTFDLVVLDVMMPRMSGYEVCQKLREHHSLEELPVIFLTAKSQVPDLVTGLAAGGSDYLAKPIDRAELLARVRTHLELLQVHRQLTQAVDDLESRNAELARFNYTVAHDLKNPLTTIRNFLGLARHDAAAGDTERLTDDLDRLDAAAARLHRLLDELFELSRAGLQSNPREEIATRELVAEALDGLSDRISECGVEIDVAADLPAVIGDRDRLFEVIRHLLDNAIRYLGDQPSPQIEISARERESEIVFYVRDNGIGIEPKYHEKIFDLFERLDPTASAGTGIGLALVKRIVEVHGGRIWVESEVGDPGSTFCFTLPRIESPRP